MSPSIACPQSVAEQAGDSVRGPGDCQEGVRRVAGPVDLGPHPERDEHREGEQLQAADGALGPQESLLLDRKDPAAALAALDSIAVAPNDPRMRPRRDMLVADALRQAGRTDSARAVLQALATQFPSNPRVKAKLDSLKL